MSYLQDLSFSSFVSVAFTRRALANWNIFARLMCSLIILPRLTEPAFNVSGTRVNMDTCDLYEKDKVLCDSNASATYRPKFTVDFCTSLAPYTVVIAHCACFGSIRSKSEERSMQTPHRPRSSRLEIKNFGPLRWEIVLLTALPPCTHFSYYFILFLGKF